MNKTDLEEFIEREESGNLDDTEMADFIELNLINDDEKAEFKKRRISVAGCFTGKWTATDSNERFLNKTFRRWNELVSSEATRLGLTPPGHKVFSDT